MKSKIQKNHSPISFSLVPEKITEQPFTKAICSHKKGKQGQRGSMQVQDSMVTTRQKTVSSVSPELQAPDRTNAATQTELLSKYTTTQICGCGMCEGIILEVESDCKQACERCDQIDELLC